MTDVLLTAHDVESIEQLLTSSADLDDRDDGELLPEGVLGTLTELFPATVACVVETDRSSGTALRSQTFPPHSAELPSRVLRATLPPTHPRRVVHLYLARSGPPFTARDRILLRLLLPSLRLREQGEADALSPSELRVLGLVAQGASNREVSESLSLSVSTVRKHLEHIYAKLGVRNRTAAAVRAFPQGPASGTRSG